MLVYQLLSEVDCLNQFQGVFCSEHSTISYNLVQTHNPDWWSTLVHKTLVTMQGDIKWRALMNLNTIDYHDNLVTYT